MSGRSGSNAVSATPSLIRLSPSRIVTTRVGAPSLELLAFRCNLVGTIFRHGAQGPCLACHWQRRGQPSAAGGEIEAALTLALGLVALFEMFCGPLVVSLERLVSGTADALLKSLQVEYAEQRVAAADIGVEESERLARRRRGR